MADFDALNIGIRSMTMRLRSATAISTSPFTYDQQVYQHQGVRWEAEVRLPPLQRADAKKVEAFLAGLRGQANSFTMSNPLHDVDANGTITIGSTNATTVTGTLGGATTGDYFSVGGHLYIITDTGSGTFDIMPPLRTAASNSALEFERPKGVWRLASNDIDWNIDKAGIYGFTFACVEAI